MCGCNKTTPRYAVLPRPFWLAGWLAGFFGLAFWLASGFLAGFLAGFWLGLAGLDLFFPCFLARLAETQLRGILQAYLGVLLQPHACAHFRCRILRRTRSFPGRTSVRSLPGAIESVCGQFPLSSTGLPSLPSCWFSNHTLPSSMGSLGMKGFQCCQILVTTPRRRLLLVRDLPDIGSSGAAAQRESRRLREELAFACEAIRRCKGAGPSQPLFFLTRSRSRKEKMVVVRLFGTARISLGGREVRRRDLPADEVVRVARHAR